MIETIKLSLTIIAVCGVGLSLFALLFGIGYRVHRRLQGRTQNPRRPATVSVVIAFLIIIYGLFTGFVAGIFSQLIPILFLYPVVMAINSGKLIVDVIRRAKIRTISQLILFSLLSAVMMYGAYHYCRYVGFQMNASLEIFEEIDKATEEKNLQATHAFLDYALKEETGHSGFIGYMLYTAREGLSIGRFYRSSRLHLGPALTWLYWAVEFGVILGLTLLRGKKLIGTPFCESCGSWYGQEKHLGGTAASNQSILLSLIHQKDFAGLGMLLRENAEAPSLEVYLQGCDTCGESQSQLTVRHAFQNAKGGLQFRDASQTTLLSTESALLLSQLSLS